MLGLNQTKSTLGQIKSADALPHLRLKLESAHVGQEATFAAQLPGRRGHAPPLIMFPASRTRSPTCPRLCETPATRIDLLKGVSI
jgi:hypothetical protein